MERVACVKGGSTTGYSLHTITGLIEGEPLNTPPPMTESVFHYIPILKDTFCPLQSPLSLSTHHVSYLVVWWTGQFDLRQLHFRCVINDWLHCEVNVWVLDGLLASLEGSVSLGSEGLSMPVELILNFRESLA